MNRYCTVLFACALTREGINDDAAFSQSYGTGTRVARRISSRMSEHEQLTGESTALRRSTLSIDRVDDVDANIINEISVDQRILQIIQSIPDRTIRQELLP